jgi:hypothetical protein
MKPEICNGIDDNCDGVVDENCPAGLTWDTAAAQPNLGASPGGSPFSDLCNNDEVLTGVKVAISNWVDSVQAVCSEIWLNADDSVSPWQYSIQIGNPRDLPAHPGGSTSPHQDLPCPDNQMIVGLKISQQDAAVASGTTTSTAAVVPKIWVLCATPVLALDATPPGVHWKGWTEIGPATGAAAGNGATFPFDGLVNPNVVVGLQGMAGQWIDQVGVAASGLSVTFTPPN